MLIKLFLDEIILTLALFNVQSLLSNKDERVVSVASRFIGVSLTVSSLCREYFRGRDCLLKRIYELSFSASFPERFGALECLQSMLLANLFDDQTMDIVRVIEWNLSSTTHVLVTQACARLAVAVTASSVFDGAHPMWFSIRRVFLRVDPAHLVEAFCLLIDLPLNQHCKVFNSVGINERCLEMVFRSEDRLQSEKWASICCKIIQLNGRIDHGQIAKYSQASTNHIYKIFLAAQMLAVYYAINRCTKEIEEMCIFISYCLGAQDTFAATLVPLDCISMPPDADDHQQEVQKNLKMTLGFRLAEFLLDQNENAEWKKVFPQLHFALA